MLRQYELVERVKAYDPDADEAVLNQAYVFAMKAHGAQRRYSGDPYFSHPIEVAGILTDLKLDTATIATALLHDVIEDTVATREDLEKHFGTEIGELVEGVTKLSKVEFSSEEAKQAENFRKLLLAMSADIRVLLVKLADRLHNMRTLEHVPGDERRRRIAQETMEIYAPLAGRMGMHEMQEELEDLSFAVLNPDARNSVLSRLSYLRAHGGNVVKRISDALKRTLAEHDIEAWIYGREKRPLSIWRKMEQKGITFEQLSDIMGFRVIVRSEEDCYKALGILHTSFRAVPARFRDYISTPKSNGYRSLHTTVIGPEQQRVEIQIRTSEMHDVAELGVAAHWSYKDSVNGGEAGRGNPYRFLQELVEMLEHGASAEEFLEHTKLEMFQDQVFCFTPKGELVVLPRGATPIDFAYAVHSEVGDRCVGAKINGKPVPLRTMLESGDSVEIICSKAQTPMPAWESVIVTGRARSAIRRFVRNAEREQFAKLGREIVDRAFHEAGYEATERVLEPLLARFKCAKLPDLYAAVGKGILAGQELVAAVLGKPGKKTPKALRTRKRTNAIPIRGLMPGLAVHLAPCCHPLPGDRIVGLVTPGKGVDVHTIDCDTLAGPHEPDRWLDLAWDADAAEEATPTGRIRVVLANELGALGSLCTVIARQEGNISNLKISDRSADFFELLVDVEVKDTKHLNAIIAALNATAAVTSVKRERA